MAKKFNELIKKTLSVIIAVQLVSAALPSVSQGAENTDSVTIYMNPNGINGSGTKEKPVSSFNNLKALLGKLDDKVKSVTVEMAGGTYYLDDGVVLNEKLIKGKELTIKAADGEKPVLAGSRPVSLDDFEAVSDKSVKDRLVPSAAAYVGVVDLGKQGFTHEQVNFLDGLEVGSAATVLGVFLNDSKETIARFSNSSYLRIGNVINGGGQRRYALNQTDGGIFEVTQPNVRRWSQAKDMYIEGFLGAEYWSEWAKVGSIDTEKQTIAMAEWTQYGLKPQHKWAAINLLEEIDTPGEWYIDSDKLLMYYYPRYPIDRKTDKLEIAVVKKPLLTLDNVSNVVIDGIGFKNSGDDGISLISCEQVTIKNSSFYNLAKVGVRATNASNVRISCNDFYDTGYEGIYLDGGDRNLLISNGCVIDNNHVYNTGYLSGVNWNGGIRIGANSVETVIRNNLLHGIKNYSYTFGGNDNLFAYNEVWNGNRETADSAPIYCGRKLSEYGNAMRYNYVHDCVNAGNSTFTNWGIVTGDDWQAGTIIENNIIDMNNRNKGLASGTHSRDGIIRYNINVNSLVGIQANDRYKYVPNIFSDPANTTTGGLIASLESDTGLKKGYATTPIWLKKHPQVSTIYQDCVDNNGRFMVRDNVITDNVSVFAPNQIEQQFIDWGTVERNLDIEDMSVFVDPDNHDYRLTMEAVKKYNLSDKLMNEENFSMSEIGIQTDERSIEKPSDKFRKLYPTNGNSNMQREGLNLKWERALYADQYSYTVAKDPEMTDIVAEGITFDTSVTLDMLENDTVYYWNVRAENISKQIGNEWDSVGEAFVFKTSKYDVLDKNILNSVINEAEEVYKTVTEGNTVGDFKTGTLEVFKTEIDEAKRVSELVIGTTETIDNAVARLRSFVSLISGYKHKGFITVNNENKDSWIVVEEKAEDYSVENGTASFNQTGAEAVAYKDIIKNHQALSFKLKKEQAQNWIGIALKQKTPNQTSYSRNDHSYLIVIKDDIFELQKYDSASASAGIIKTADNNGIFTADKWHDFRFGAITVEKGVNIFLTIDGNKIFDYLDSVNPITAEGYFALTANANVLSIMQGDVPEGEYIPDESIYNNGETVKSTYFKVNEDGYNETGKFDNSEFVGFENAAVRTTVGGTAEWNEIVPMKNYKIYYWHTPLKDGDKNAKVIFETSGGGLGSTVFEKNVDFSGGEEGWTEIGTFLTMAPDAKNSVANVKIVGSGNGKIAASAIRLDESTESESRFSKLFYEDGKSVMLFKIGKNELYNNIAKSEIDVAPKIVDGRTLVPVRAIAEGFGFDVSYNDADKTVSLKNGEIQIDMQIGNNEFTVNSETRTTDMAPCIENGITLLPLRALSEAIGKKVVWDESRKLIIIADSLKITEENISEYKEVLDIADGKFK